MPRTDQPRTDQLSAPLSRLTLRLVAALTLMAQAAVHWQLWRAGYRNIAAIGPLFLAGVVAAVILSVVVVVRPGAAAVAAALALSVGQVAGLALSKTVGLLGFMSQATLTRPEIAAVAAEVVAAFALAALLLLPRRRPVAELIRALRSDRA